MAAFNGVNRGVYIADNLDFLRAINTASVDLVCIDPPFAKNDTFTGDKLKPPLSRAEEANEQRLLERRWGIGTPEEADAAGIAWPDDPKAKGGYRDTWSWDEDIHADWIDGIKATHPAVNMLIETTREIHGDSVAAYLCFMAIRLFEVHRVLKPTGSLYLHCDHTANGYLRQLLDGVFGADNFRNEIVWRRFSAHNDAQRFGQIHDTLFYYSKSRRRVWTGDAREPYDPDYIAKSYRYEDDKGRFMTSPLQARSLLGGGYSYAWRGIADVWKFPQERLDELDAAGLIYWPPKGKIPRRKVYLDPERGIAPRDLILDIKPLMSGNEEQAGYPTQKPYKLAERLIQASSNPGDVVLDCFAGCAYVAIAAEKLGRRWVACDINPRAWTVFKRQFNKGGDLPLLTCDDQTAGQQVLGSEPTVTIHGPGELPLRTDGGGGVEVKPLRTDNRRQGERKYKRESTLMDRGEMLTALLRFSAGRAWCCGFLSRNADGSLSYGDYELDHVTPKSFGGTDEIENRAPLCSAHNGLKSNRDITLAELRYEVIERGELKVPARSLPKLSDAFEYALRVKQEAYQRKFGKRGDV